MTDFYEIARGLLDCACIKLATDCPGNRCVIAGVEPEWNCCEDGMMTINLVNSYPSKVFPNPDFGTDICVIPLQVLTFRITLLRCIDVSAGPADCQALGEQASTQLHDIQRVTEGLVCCLTDTESMSCLLGGGYRWALGTALTLGPEANCVGFSQDVVVGAAACWDCCA